MLNQVNIIGNLGADPDVRTTPTGQLVATLRVAVSERFKDREGQWKDATEWVTLVCWGHQAEFAQRYLTKGRKVFATGKLKTRSWDDAKTGGKRYVTEVVAERVQGLDRADGGQQGHHEQQRLADAPRGQQSQRAAAPVEQADEGGFFDEDVPF